MKSYKKITLSRVNDSQMTQTHRIFLGVKFALQVQRSAPSVAHENLTELAKPGCCWFKELQSSYGRALRWCTGITRNIVSLLEGLAPRSIAWVLRGLLQMLLGVEMIEIILCCLRKGLTWLAPMDFRIVNNEVELLFSEKN